MEKKRAKELDKIDPNLIESMNVLKGKCLRKYGRDGENGLKLSPKNISSF
jgi:hypothetical protein